MTQKDVDEMIAGLDAPSGGETPAPESEDVLELTESMAAQPADEDVPNFQTIDGQSDVVFSDAPSEPAPRPIEEPRRHHSQSNAPDRALLSASTSAAVDSAFNALAQTVLVQNARTLEDLVREMLRPMLKSWLDDNLPNLVERIVKAEIERVSRGRG
jgi:cell pole-organizing protein PopZ